MAKKQSSEFKLPDFDARSFQISSTRFRVLYAAIAFVAITVAVFVAVDLLTEDRYPSVSEKEYQILEKEIEQSVEKSLLDQGAALDELDELENKLPRKLENRRNFVMARIYESQGEQAAAFHHYYQIENDYMPRFVKSSLVEISEKIGFERIVMNELQALRRAFPKEPKYTYALAKSYLRQSMFDKAKELFADVQRTFAATDYALGADYYLANLEDTKEETYKRLKNYINNSTDGSLAALIAEQIESLPEEEAKQFRDYSAKLGMVFFHRENYKKALEYFEKAPELAPLLEYALALKEENYKTKAKDLLLSSLPKVDDEEIAAPALELLMSLSNRWTVLAQLRELYPQMQVVQDKILWHIAERTKAKEDYENVYQRFPESRYAAESMATVFWKEFERKAYHNALALYKKHWQTYPDTRSHPFVAFWAGKIYQLQNQKDMMQAAFQNLIAAHPNDFYSYRAEQIITGVKDWYILPPANQFVTYAQWQWPEPKTIDQIQKQHGKELAELIYLKQFDLALAFAEEEKSVNADSELKMWLNAQSERNLDAIRLAYRGMKKDQRLDIDDIHVQYAFPLAYAGLVADEVSQRLKVDPLLAHSLIRQESNYQPDIVSKVGAVGLMQLMPYTAKDVARRVHIETPEPSDLMQAHINIKLGIKYMEEVFESFDNNMIHAIASYNAGPVAVRSWKRKYDQTDPDLFIENIPYPETRNYVKKVLNNYWIYKDLYA